MIIEYPIVAVDFGLKRVGFAWAEAPLAEPLVVMENDDKLLDHCLELIKFRDASMVVVGVSEGEMAKQQRQFIKSLQSKLSIPVVEWDETLSTVEARAKLARRSNKPQRNQVVDDLAAAEFLQDFIDVNGSGVSH